MNEKLNHHPEEEATEREEELLEDVSRVQSMELVGAPKVFLFDDEALAGADEKVAKDLALKINSLREGGAHIIVASPRGDIVRQQYGGVEIRESIASIGPGEEIVAIVGREPAPAGAVTFAVGESQPTEASAIRLKGPAGTDAILGHLLSAYVQERAGFAFRAAGKGEAIPSQAQFDKGIFTGIGRLLAPPEPEERTTISRLEGKQWTEARQHPLRVAERAYPAIDTSCAESGAIAAAAPPKTEHDPNYWFFWQRDAGQVVLAMANLSRATQDEELQNRIQGRLDKFVEFVEMIPKQPGLEPVDLAVSRFTIDGEPIRTYGNPQNDGPAYTALAVLSALGETHEAYGVAKPYLDFLTTKEGVGLTFDPAEFSVGHIFNVDNLARRALQKGASLAEKAGDKEAVERYRAQEASLRERLTSYFDEKKGYLTAGRDLVIRHMHGGKNLDMNVIGSILTAYNVEDDFLNVEDPRVVKTMETLEREFAEKWPVNRVWRGEGNEGMGLGRFPEDMNDGIYSTGGNPWSISTLWAAQYYLRRIERESYLGNLTPDRRDLYMKKADGYLSFVLTHLPADSLTEQIDGRTGKPRGAEKLAWAHAELINALLTREEVTASRGGKS